MRQSFSVYGDVGTYQHSLLSLAGTLSIEFHLTVLWYARPLCHWPFSQIGRTASSEQNLLQGWVICFNMSQVNLTKCVASFKWRCGDASAHAFEKSCVVGRKLFSFLLLSFMQGCRWPEKICRQFSGKRTTLECYLHILHVLDIFL